MIFNNTKNPSSGIYALDESSTRPCEFIEDWMSFIEDYKQFVEIHGPFDATFDEYIKFKGLNPSIAFVTPSDDEIYMEDLTALPLNFFCNNNSISEIIIKDNNIFEIFLFNNSKNLTSIAFLDDEFEFEKAERSDDGVWYSEILKRPYFTDTFKMCPKLKEIKIIENKTYKAEDGFFYRTDGILYFMAPAANFDDLPKDITEIAVDAIKKVPSDIIIIPNHVKSLAHMADSSDLIKESPILVLPENMDQISKCLCQDVNKIYCKPGTETANLLKKLEIESKELTLDEIINLYPEISMTKANSILSVQEER